MYDVNTLDIELREKVIAIKNYLKSAREITLELINITSVKSIIEYKIMLLSKVIDDAEDAGIITSNEKSNLLIEL